MVTRLLFLAQNGTTYPSSVVTISTVLVAAPAFRAALTLLFERLRQSAYTGDNSSGPTMGSIAGWGSLRPAHPHSHLPRPPCHLYPNPGTPLTMITIARLLT
jgi:hypothetical protein